MAYYLGTPKPHYTTGPHCSGCPFRALSYGFVESVGPRDKVLLLGEGPGHWEVKGGRPFIGRSGTVINRIINEHCAYHRAEMRITNAIHCRWVERGPDGEPILGKNSDMINCRPPSAMVHECNSQARGNLYGLSLSSTRAHITRAILEGSAYGMKDIMEALKNMGLTFSKIRVSGGGSRSRLWNQIKADVLNLPVETLSTPETTSLGAALIGATSYGAYPNLKIASECSIKIKDVVTPGDQRTEYEHIYPRYRDLYFSIKPLFK